MLKRSASCALAASLALALGACGSSGSSSGSSSSGSGGRLDKAQYQQQLKAIGKQESQAQARVQKALHATSVSQLRTLLDGFAADQQSVARKLAAIKPPANAQKANAALMKAFRDNAAAIKGVVSQISHAKSPQAAIGAIGKASAAQKSGQEIDQALQQLKKLGYTAGS